MTAVVTGGSAGIGRAICEDLLAQMQLAWGGACQVDQATLAALMADIDDPVLRGTLLDLCLAIIDADDHLADGESVLLQAAAVHWNLHPATLQPQPAGCTG